MADTSDKAHHEELQSDLDMLIDMVKNAQHDEQVVMRHVESLKAKLDKLVHSRHRAGSDA